MLWNWICLRLQYRIKVGSVPIDEVTLNRPQDTVSHGQLRIQQLSIHVEAKDDFPKIKTWNELHILIYQEMHASASMYKHVDFFTKLTFGL